MKLTKTKLQEIIREEVALINEEQQNALYRKFNAFMDKYQKMYYQFLNGLLLGKNINCLSATPNAAQRWEQRDIMGIQRVLHSRKTGSITVQDENGVYYELHAGGKFKYLK